MGSPSKPDLLVAVDLGTTYTGVGWARPQAQNLLQSPIQIIQNWPGCSTRNDQKVPTCLVYKNDAGMSLSSWGFLCEDDDDPDSRRYEFFKIFLDQQTLKEAHRQGISAAPASTAEAQQLVKDYLEQIYLHVKQTIQLQAGISPGQWKDMVIEFIFSVPTTWRTQESINTFKDTIARAGFGKDGTRHAATVELTESEAASVASIKKRNVFFQKGDIFLSVDAGGGTTDFALMQVTEAGDPFPMLSQVTQVDGVGIGSTLIDRAFVRLAHGRLAQFLQVLEQLPPDCVQNLARSERFKSMKHKFGKNVYETPVYKLPMEGVAHNFHFPQAGIEAGRILFSREQIQSLFDPHIQAMLAKIRSQLDWFQNAHPGFHMDYLILSGGLGSSAYVRDEIQTELEHNPHPCADRITIIQDPEPQLVVVKGLLYDRMQKLESGNKAVLSLRKARASYGVVCKHKFNPNLHIEEQLQVDPIDGQAYAMGQIDWIIMKGDLVDPEKPIKSEFKQKIDPASPTRKWDYHVVISHSDKRLLPRSIKDPNVKKLCTVQSDLSSVKDSELQLFKQSRGWRKRNKKWYICTFEVRAILAPADLRFELWFAGQKYSRNHEAIKLVWDDSGTKLAAELPSDSSSHKVELPCNNKRTGAPLQV